MYAVLKTSSARGGVVQRLVLNRHDRLYWRIAVKLETVGNVPQPAPAVVIPKVNVCPAVIAAESAPESTKVFAAPFTVTAETRLEPVTSNTPTASGERCTGTNQSAIGDNDWAECPWCMATGWEREYTTCSRCFGNGWLFQRR